MLPYIQEGQQIGHNNYRPVFLTLPICNTKEHIVVSQIMKHLDQHRFTSEHTCEAQLFLPTNDLAEAIDNKAQVDMAILGFQRLSTKLHTRLKHKLVQEYYGIRGNLLGWLRSFLGNRTQQLQMVVGGTYFSCSPRLSSWPILLLLYTSDIRTNINGQLCLYAVDCLIYQLI